MLLAILDPTKPLREEVKKQAELHEMLSRVGATYGLTFEEINNALMTAVHKKRTTSVERELTIMKQKSISL